MAVASRQRADGRPRVAWASPLPPSRSGIADYAAEVLPALAEVFDLVLVREPGAPVDPALVARHATMTAADLPSRRHEFDALLLHLGNNGDYHAWILDLLDRAPGLVVLHEFVLHHMLRELTLAAGRPDAYVEELRYAYGALGWAVGRRAVDHGVPADEGDYPLFERVVDRACGVVVHNRGAFERVARARPGARLWRVPHPVLGLGEGGDAGGVDDAHAGRRAARRALGLDPDAFWVGSFGFFTEAKRPQAVIEGFARLRREHPSAMLLIAGEVARAVERQGLLDALDQGAVRVLGRLPLDEFQRAIAAVDVAVNLRWPWGGESSGALLRLLAGGVPTLVSDVGAFAEIPEGCAIRIPAGSLDPRAEALWVGEALRLVAGDPDLRRDLGRNARRFATVEHAMARTVAGYAEVVRQASHPPHRLSAAGEPLASVPPLAVAAPGDVLAPLSARLAEDLFALGFEEPDAWVQVEAAGWLVDLDLDAGLDPGPDRDAGSGSA